MPFLGINGSKETIEPTAECVLRATMPQRCREERQGKIETRYLERHIFANKTLFCARL